MHMIEHQPQQQRFCVGTAKEEAVLTYQLTGNQLHFTQTYVPDGLRGQGIAEKLVRTGLRWAREQGYDVTTSCWYVDRFLEQEKTQ